MNLKLLWYCTKNKPYLIHMPKDQEEFENGIEFSLSSGEEFKQACIDIKALSLYLNGKIVAESDYDCEEIIHTYENGASVHHRYNTKTLDNEQLLRKSRIIGYGLNDYLGDHNYDKNNNVVGYAIHIKNLVVDGWRDLEEFFTCGRDNVFRHAKRPPQNMMKVWAPAYPSYRYPYPSIKDEYVLISIRPEWACKILNGEKTIEVRKQVLNCMKGN